ncbi:hypothetical protein H0H87_010483 [Tephrocybe sp. NHM501043]|nr:hypothetical protein H0H87_010483 [Tephrocybe sp. NHM501043]
MANQQAYNAYMQNKGTLVPGQSIVVNKFTVQVERYLSQGGFAHVYLVRTATPVYNTTHHVLKRIAVANEAMLAEVKKEVDVMRLLKGHPNIVHLIDAAWHQMPNGMYEVFILMEFCPGGGIIDMMNRRLRERLTEAEILQIFVDVCEGVACMHNLRPALLHRDLKVENILQSTSTSYKLCDFGSATTVSRPPATTQEIRVLEADLNRHTTLQYRAPEMVDVYSRRPVDEKSDVWALGVLLYKLCYYTTPFEEHGQLAILNVQYKIPPYPVYSPQMNGLIASMLQEHGVRRPSVFEVLTHVHRLRGTKSRFKYIIPTPQPLSPRQQTSFKPSPSPTAGRNDLMSVPQSSRVKMSISPSRGQVARDQVIEAIAPHGRGEQGSFKEAVVLPPSSNIQKPLDAQPIRRGRPPAKELEQKVTKDSASRTEWLDKGFATNGDLWVPTSASRADGALSAAWRVEGKSPRLGDSQDANVGFGDGFASKLWDSAAGRSSEQLTLASSKPSPPLPSRPQQPLGINRRPSPNKDAFDGLGLALAEKPAPTLAEARKLRTGLAIMHSSGFRTNPDRSAPKPSPSPRQSATPQSQLYPSSVNSSIAETSKAPSSRPSPRSAPSTQSHLDGISAENRFPSLEELDSGFSLPMPSNSFTGVAFRHGREESVSLTRRDDIVARPSVADTSLLKPGSHPRGYHSREGTRSEQVTGVAMRDTQESTTTGRFDGKITSDSAYEVKKSTGGPNIEGSSSLRPGLSSRTGSFPPVDAFRLSPSLIDTPATTHSSPRTVHDRALPSPRRKKPRDWLTGDEDVDESSGTSPTSLLSPPAPGHTPVLRDSPSKRASVVENSLIPIQSAVAQHDHTSRTPSPSTEISPTLSKFTQSFPPIDGFDETPKPATVTKHSHVTKRIVTRPLDDTTASSGEEGPEDAVSIVRQTRKMPTERKGHKGRQSSVHDLVDLYGGGLTLKEKERETRPAQPSNLDLTSKSPGQNGQSTGMGMKLAKPYSNATSNTLHAQISTSSYSRSGEGDQHASPTSGATSGPTPSPRSRPQSMFLLPSKTIESHPMSVEQRPPSPGLAPPSEKTKRRPVRRTSISDIVQRYEGINGASKPSGSSSTLSSAAPPTIVKLPGLASNDAHTPKKPFNMEIERTGSSLSVSIGDYVPGRQSQSPTALNFSSPTPAIGRPVPIRHHTFQKEPDPTTRTTSIKSEPVRIPKFPINSTTEDTLCRTEGGSSSPERPYQGVGKLIDQWQRKTVEAESPKMVMRGRGTFNTKPSRGVPESST